MKEDTCCSRSVKTSVGGTPLYTPLRAADTVWGGAGSTAGGQHVRGGGGNDEARATMCAVPETDWRREGQGAGHQGHPKGLAASGQQVSESRTCSC